MEAAGLTSSRHRLRGVKSNELVQGFTLETPNVLNKEKLQASGCLPTHLGTGTDDCHRNSLE